MKRFAILVSVFATVLVVVLPFVGGGGPGLSVSAVADSGSATPPLASASEPAPVTEVSPIGYTQRLDEPAIAAVQAATAVALASDWEHLAQKPVPKPVVLTDLATPAQLRAAREAAGGACPGMPGGAASGSGGVSAAGVPGTTSADIASFAHQYNAIRVANCLDPIPFANFYVDTCMEARLFWMAESPSPDPMDAWGHMGSVRIDGVPSVGCDGNLAGGSGNTGATVAQKWWDSGSHRASLYRPASGIGGVCIAFAMTHGGIDEPYSFTRAAARWVSC